MKLKIPGYKTINKNAVKAAGGTAILVKYNIPYTEIKIPNDIRFDCLCIKLHSNIFLISAYCSPRIKLTRNEMNTLFNIGNKVLLIGDLNATHTIWGCRRNNNRGKTVFEYAQRNNCTLVYTDENTHCPMNGANPSKIDIGINKNVNNISTLITIAELSSDHNPVICSIGNQKKEKIDRKILDYETAKWEELRQIISKKLNITQKINNKEELDETLENLTNIIQQAIKKTIKKKTANENNNELPGIIIEQIKVKNKMRKTWQTTRRKEDKTKLN